MNRSHVCIVGSIFMYPWLWEVVAKRFEFLSLSLSLSLFLSRFLSLSVLSPFIPFHPSAVVRLSLFRFSAYTRERERESWYVCTRTSRIVLDVARTFADWRLVEITLGFPLSLSLFLCHSLSFSLSLWITASPIYKHRYETNAKMNWTSWATDQQATNSKKGHNGARNRTKADSWPRTTIELASRWTYTATYVHTSSTSSSFQCWG